MLGRNRPRTHGPSSFARRLARGVWAGAGRVAIGGFPIDEKRLARRLEERLRGKTVLITGASRGIGRALAFRVAAAGAVTLLTARDREQLELIAEAIRGRGGTAHAYPADLSRDEECAELVSSALERHGGVDVLVNNAGRSRRTPIDKAFSRRYRRDRTLELNYLAGVRLAVGLLPEMRRRGGGQIVSVSTISAEAMMPQFSDYNASKSAFDAYCRSLAPEVAAEGVRMSVVYLPLVRTAMSAPTTSFRVLPSLSSEQAAARLCKVLIRRSRRTSTPIGTVWALTWILSPRLHERFFRLGDRALDTYVTPAAEMSSGSNDAIAGSGSGRRRAVLSR
jgi:NAD(P)-dependent dehydrogenase (short-subunit alcohol dehydrogenase family)